MKKLLFILLFSTKLFGQVDSAKVDSIVIKEFNLRIEQQVNFQKYLDKQFKDSKLIEAYLRKQVQIIEEKKK